MLGVVAAGAFLIDLLLGRARQRLTRVTGYPADWQEGFIAAQTGLFLTAQEAKDLGETMNRQVEPYLERWHDPALRPPGSLRYELLVFGYPLTDPGD
jgi:hypothetical protein